jgi:hypothetical protein
LPNSKNVFAWPNLVPIQSSSTKYSTTVVLISENGQPIGKSKVVDAHRPAKAPKFTRVEMSDMKIIDHGTAAVVTCRGTYEAPQSSVTLKFMRVWVKKNNDWKIVAGSISH